MGINPPRRIRLAPKKWEKWGLFPIFHPFFPLSRKVLVGYHPPDPPQHHPPGDAPKKREKGDNPRGNKENEENSEGMWKTRGK